MTLLVGRIRIRPRLGAAGSIYPAISAARFTVRPLIEECESDSDGEAVVSTTATAATLAEPKRPEGGAE